MNKKGRITKKCKECKRAFSLVSSKKDTKFFCSKKCYTIFRKKHPLRFWLGKRFSEEHRKKIGASHMGEKHYLWKGGRIYDKGGYILVLCKDHPNANPNGYVREHRLIMESHIGRFLEKNEVVHHKNGKRSDNRIQNLVLYSENSTHLRDEWADGKIRPHYKYNQFVCSCGCKKHYAKGYCHKCYDKLRNSKIRL